MQITVIKGDILNSHADLIAIGIYEDENWDNSFISRVNDLFGGKVKKIAQSKGFAGKIGESFILPAPEGISSDFVLIVGLGKQSPVSMHAISEAAGLVIKTGKDLNVRTVAMEFFGEDDENFQADKSGELIAKAFLLADYGFHNYKSDNKEAKIVAATIVAEDGRDVRKAERGIEKASIVVDGITVARDLVNSPALDMTPTRLAEAAENISKMSDGLINVRIYDRQECKKRGMGAFLSIARGSEEEPKFIHLLYKPKNTKKKIKKVALVGKGVTFDSGGLSLKPSNAMETMKCDMAGAAAVLGVFATLSRLKPNVEVHGVIAATENMPSGKAIKPGDIVRAMNGKTIEIANTDAEGRVTLADSLSYAVGLKPDYVIDLATLTGACVVALGEEVAGIMGNNKDLVQSILNSAEKASENMWELPLFDGYLKLIKSDVADVKNISSSRYGGALTAGLFLSHFIPKEQKWAHIDIAGPSFAERPFGSYISKGGTGYGVATLVSWLKNM